MNNEVQTYIDKQASPQKEIMKKIRRLLQKTAPMATETMSYGVPAFKLSGSNLMIYAAFKNHVGIYPEPETIKIFEKELTDYETSKGAVKFKIDEPIPYGLIEKITKYRIKMKLKK